MPNIEKLLIKLQEVLESCRTCTQFNTAKGYEKLLERFIQNEGNLIRCLIANNIIKKG